MERNPIPRILAVFLALDALFTGLLGYAYFVMMGLEVNGFGAGIVSLLGLWVVKFAAWALSMRAGLQPVARWFATPNAPTDARSLREVGVAAYRAPFVIGVSWASLFGTLTLVHTLILYYGFADTVPLGPRSIEAAVVVGLGTGIGALALAFPLAEWLMAPVLAKVSLAAHDRGVTIPGRGLNFRLRLIAFALAIALAPSLYLGAITYMNDARSSLRDLARAAELAVAEAALGHPDAAGRAGGLAFTFGAAGASVDGPDAARALAEHPVLARSFEAAAQAAPTGSVTHPRHGVVAFRAEAGRNLGVVIQRAPTVSFRTLVLLLVFFVIIITWGPMSAAFIGNSTATPIKRISEALTRVGDGEVTAAAKVPVFHQDEVGALATSYNMMLDQLRELARRAHEVSQGNLAVEFTVRGDLGDAFRGQLHSLRDMVGHIALNSAQLAGAATEMYAAAQEQEVTARKQSIGVEEVARTMDSLLVASAHVRESTTGVLAKAERTLETTSRTSTRIGEMSAHAGRIGDILDTIREIADRSDLLALNASLEGSHAGEAGRGFGLVAAEMRKLAERVTESVHSIKALVGDVRASVSATVLATEESSKLAQGTTESARHISMVTQQQQSGTEQAGQSMRDIAAMLTQSLAATQQIRTLSESLKLQADNLAGLVARFQLPERRRGAA